MNFPPPPHPLVDDIYFPFFLFVFSTQTKMVHAVAFLYLSSVNVYFKYVFALFLRSGWDI